MKTIHKFELAMGETSVRLAAGAYPAAFGFQNRKPFVWLVVDPRQEDRPTRYDFMIVGTGHNIPDGWHHLFTSFDLYDETGLVAHLCWKKP